ncbi:tartrate-resistant acid phosphatase type 5-like [Gordionus sp. m RMFG-2023]|uniref:tartrate-resistant acid phosphatase type 5-like n=1 Tax=Gordionus sp. m RMFG-2023 TaxID=3053472 RepID=UPI0031FD2A10
MLCDGQDELIYRFIAIGDTGGQPIEPYVSEMQLKVAETMKEFVIINKTSVLLLGDNFYADGVEDIKDDRFKITFENVYLGPLKDINWYVIAGNHDYRGNVTAQMEYRKKSERCDALLRLFSRYRMVKPIPRILTRAFINFNKLLNIRKYPDLYYKIGLMIDIKYRDNESLKESIVIDVLMLDTNVLINKGSNGLEEEKYVNEDSQLHHKQWLYNHMSMADFLVVAGHHPIYSFGVAGATKLLQFLNPWLRDNMASLFICGHDHDLQYIEEDTDNITMKYAVFGSGSKLDLQRRIYPYANERKIFRYAEKGGFGLLNFMYPSKRLVVAYYNEDGVFLYRKKIYRRNQQFYQNK